MAAKVVKKGTYLVDPVRSRVFRLFIFKERKFFTLLILLFLTTGIFYPYPKIAMWLGFLFAGYAAIANDSIQTIGTFLASNMKKPWWLLALYIGGIFVVTMLVSWFMYDGDVPLHRLSSKDFDEAPQEFQFLQLAAPLVLLLLTRLQMPVSTTFLCLSAYASSMKGITSVLQKSLMGYAIAFVVAFIVWYLFSKAIKGLVKGKAHPAWTFFQWIISGILWAVWLMQDLANIAVTLPRSLSAVEVFFFIALGVLFYLRGDKIQNVVTKKSEVKDVRGATVIDFVYALILIFFQNMSKVPMSTTWVFIGLLGGREIAMTLAPDYKLGRKMKKTWKLVRGDVRNASIGLIVSIIVAVLVNKNLQEELKVFVDEFWSSLRNFM